MRGQLDCELATSYYVSSGKTEGNAYEYVTFFRSDEGLTLETSDFQLFTMAN